MWMVLSHIDVSHKLCEVEINCDQFLSTEKTGSTKGRGLCRAVIPQRGLGPISPPQQKHQLVSRRLPETPGGESHLHVEALAANSDQLLAVVLFHHF